MSEQTRTSRGFMSDSAKTEATWLWIHRVLMPILMLLLTATVSIGGFIGTKVWNRVEDGFTNLDGRVDVLEVETARTSGNHFTTQNWSEAKARIDEDRTTMDRRITRVEEAVPQIKESLIRIERKLDRTPPDL